MITDNIGTLILHIPHSSTKLPKDFRVLEGVSLNDELQRMTDWFTEELFNCKEATKLVFPYSRLYCDVERFREDKDESMASKGMGVCYTHTSYGADLREIDDREKEYIKASLYDPHHKRLEEMVDEKLKQYNTALIMDCHSFSNFPLPHEVSQIRPDICIGTDDFHTPPELIKSIQGYFEGQSITVAIDEPFAGTMVPLKHYHKDKRVKSIMIEVNRKLYLDEVYKQNDNFNTIKEILNDTYKKFTI